MKRNILLVLLLIGICIVEACWNCGGRTDYKLNTINNNCWTIKKPYLEKNDTVLFGDLAITIDLKWVEASVLKKGTTIFACGEHEFYRITDLDSVNVVANKKYTDLKETTSCFRVRGTNEELTTELIKNQFASYAPFYVDSALEFLLEYPPSQIDTFQFTFQFFDTDGNIFETTTDPIIITP